MDNNITTVNGETAVTENERPFKAQFWHTQMELPSSTGPQ